MATTFGLCKASAEGDLDVVSELIVDRGANPNFGLYCQMNLTPLHIASKNGRSQIVKFLLEASCYSPFEIVFSPIKYFFGV